MLYFVSTAILYRCANRSLLALGEKIPPAKTLTNLTSLFSVNVTEITKHNGHPVPNFGNSKSFHGIVCSGREYFCSSFLHNALIGKDKVGRMTGVCQFMYLHIGLINYIWHYALILAFVFWMSGIRPSYGVLNITLFSPETGIFLPGMKITG